MSAAVDTFKIVQTLQASGMPEKQAEAVMAVMRDTASGTESITNNDLPLALAPLKSDVLLLKWMVGVIVAGVVALVMKAFVG
ncbi:MAG: CCDC90 family protein [Burkholderiaceae bacterium]|jgi:uncharacterized protein YceK|nr:CCDC90 family protein [Burkholderiaceae bacterium]